MSVNGGVKVRADEIVGLRELISEVILRERDKLVPAALLQDVEEVRRSPAGAVIRMEGKIDRLEEEMVALRAEMVTKEDLAALRAEMVTKGEWASFEKAMGTRFEEQGKRIDLLQKVFFAFFTLLTGLQVAILVKLFL